MSGMSLLAGKALSSARMSDILSQSSLTGSQQLHQREESGQWSLDTHTHNTHVYLCSVVVTETKIIRDNQTL